MVDRGNDEMRNDGEEGVSRWRGMSQSSLRSITLGESPTQPRTLVLILVEGGK